MAQNDAAVRYLNELYQLFVEMGFADAQDISWPPHEDGSLNESMCRTHGLSDSTLDVLRKIPWPKGDGYLPIDETTYAVNWSNEDHVSTTARWPDDGHHGDGIPDDEEIPAGRITVSTFLERPGMIVALDTGTGMLDVYDCDYGHSDVAADTPEQYFGELLKKYKLLEHIPAPRGEMEILTEDLDYRGNVYTRTRTMLLDYGWPTDFRRADFVRDYTEELRESWEHDSRVEQDQIRQELKAEDSNGEIDGLRSPGRIQESRARARAKQADIERGLKFLELHGGSASTKASSSTT
ncbi:uncharacterized protein AB675_8489 [Cyphellophora attinorum]|uniref:Uncharacterized protein n=1 Tax=Cyphellophora attinorum TaxID=1664694 RepID=A0A0N1HA21_9EURO|nr:uncharacterized protein AB675_8489 [Phialophora attinorum]KPI44597.1 hypothetical protein AB675_8489 [Phialophora attinorum]